MNKLTHWIKRHQVTAFFIITFAITWGLGFSYNAVLNKGIVFLFPLAAVATCGPALAGIIITAVTNTQPRQGSSKTPLIAFLIAWVVSALVWLANITLNNLSPFSPAMVGFALVTVIPVAFVLSMAYSRIPAVKSYLASLIRLRGMWGWALLALVLLPGLILLSTAISSLLGRQPTLAFQFPEAGLALIGLVTVKFFYQFFFFNATGEEVGWRGFALPRLQSCTSPLLASLIISLFWVLWHFFLWKAEGRPVLTLQFWLGQFALHLPASVIIGWLYNRSKGSILVAGIAHAAANTAFAFFPNLDWTVYALTFAVAALVMILVDRMWKKLPSDHPRSSSQDLIFLRPISAASTRHHSPSFDHYWRGNRHGGVELADCPVAQLSSRAGAGEHSRESFAASAVGFCVFDGGCGQLAADCSWAIGARQSVARTARSADERARNFGI